MFYQNIIVIALLVSSVITNSYAQCQLSLVQLTIAVKAIY